MSFDDLHNYYNTPEKATENEAKTSTEQAAMANEDAWATFLKKDPKFQEKILIGEKIENSNEGEIKLV